MDDGFKKEGQPNHGCPSLILQVRATGPRWLVQPGYSVEGAGNVIPSAQVKRSVVHEGGLSGIEFAIGAARERDEKGILL